MASARFKTHVTRYALFLTDVICDHYFHRPDKTKSYRNLWKTKKFRTFVHYLMDETFLLKKLSMVEAIISVPSSVSSAVKHINDVRNAVTHSIFPENRRRYMDGNKVIYNGVDLFTLEGVEKLQQDYEAVRVHFDRRVFG